VPDEILTLDGVIDLIHGDFEWGGVCFSPTVFGGVSSHFIDDIDCSI